ncbi:MAG: beta strand repeat-containing protein, partial [Planctomycetia bacterium]
GTLVLSGSNSYTGGTTINSGTIMLSGAGTLGSGTAGLALGGGALDLGGLPISAGNVSITSAPSSGNQIQNGTLTGTAFSVSNTSGVSTISANLAGVGAALSKSGAGTLVLSGSNSFTGGVTLTGGQVQIANANALGSGAFTTNVDADTTIAFNLPTSGTGANAITINKPVSNRTYYFQQNQANNVTLAGNITVASGNANWFSLNSGLTSGTFTLTGSNAFSGDVFTSSTNITFRIGGVNAAGNSPTVWRVSATSKMVLLDGASFSRVNNSVASYSMETSGSATMANDVYNKDGNTTVVDLPAGAQLTFAATIRAEGGFTTGTFSKTGAGTWIVNNAAQQMTYNLLGGTLQVPSFTALGGSSAASYVVLNGGTLRYAGSGASTAREFTLGASGGSLDASGSGSAAFTSAAAVSFTGSGNRTLTLTGTNTGNNVLAMALNDNGADKVSLTKTGAGTWSLSGSSGYSGGTTLSAGRLNVSNANALGGGAGNLVVTGGTLDLGNYAITRSGTVSLTGGTIQSGTLTNDTVAYDAQAGTVSAALAGAAGLVKSTSGTVTLSGANTFGGGVTLSAGQLNVNGATALGTGTFTISGGTIDNTSGGAITLTANNAQNWNSDVTFAGSNSLNLGTGAVTLGADRVVTVTSSTLTVGGAIGGAFAMTKAGAGTLVLSASNARTQATTINAGTISLTGLSGTATQPSASDLANTPITVNAGATLLAGGTVSGQNSHLINQDLTLNGGTLASNGVSGNNNYNFALGGSARIIAGGGTTSTISASLGVQGTKEFQVGAGSTLTASGVIGNWEGQSWGTINKTGAGTLALTYNGNNYGGLVLTAGTVAVSSGAWANAAGPGYRADFQGNATLQWAAGNTTDISASSKLRIGDGVTATLDTGVNAVSLATAIVLGTNKTGALTKLGSGTLTISASNAFSGATTISAGVLSITDKTALEGTSGVTIAGGAGLAYTGGVATFGKNVTVTAGSGTGTVTNSGGGLLTLSGTLSKDNSVLRLTGGSFNVTGLITGTTAGTSDLVVDAASVQLSNTNSYNGPTYVYNSGTLSLGIDNAIPNTSVVYLGNATTRGTLVTGTFSDTISQLVFSGSGGTLSLSGDKTAAAQLATNGSLTLGANASLVLTSAGTSAGLYRLISFTSSSGSFASITGTSAAYQVITTSSSIDYQQRAVLGAVGVTNPAVSIITGGSAAFTYTVANSALSGGASLGFTSSSLSANLAGTSSGTAAAGGSSGAISGLVFTGTTVGSSQTGTFTVSAPTAYGATTATGTVTVTCSTTPTRRSRSPAAAARRSSPAGRSPRSASTSPTPVQTGLRCR